MEPIDMKSSIGTFALRFAATVVLFAPAAAAQAQGIGQSHLSRCVGLGIGQVCAGVQQRLLSATATPNVAAARASSQAHNREREYRTDRSRCRGAKGAVAGHRAPRPAEFKFLSATVPDDRLGRLPKISAGGSAAQPIWNRGYGLAPVTVKG